MHVGWLNMSQLHANVPKGLTEVRSCNDHLATGPHNAVCVSVHPL